MDGVDAAADRLACTRCIGDERLRAEARAAGFDADCGYCGRHGPCVDVAWLADRIHPALQMAFAPADGDTASIALDDDATPLDEDGTRALDGVTVTASIGGLDDALARDVHHTLVTLFRDADDRPTYPQDGRYRERTAQDLPELQSWETFVQVATATRPAGDAALLEALKWALAGLDALATAKRRPALRPLAAGTRLFAVVPEALATRASLHDAGRVLTVVAFAGPLNGHGVPAIALGLRERTTVTESLAPRGARVTVARMRIARPLRILDLEAARKALARTSAFDAGRAAARARARFLDGLAGALQSPASGAARDATWRATQRVGDWLAHGASPRVDGLLTRSVHAPGRTLTLFAPACATGALVVERERHYAVDALRAKYRRVDRADPPRLRPRAPPARRGPQV
jgi:hypothetical protein